MNQSLVDQAGQLARAPVMDPSKNPNFEPNNQETPEPPPEE